MTASAIEGDETRMSRPTAIVLRLELLDVGSADRVAALLVELGRVEAADVVGLEDLRVERHAPHATSPTRKLGLELAGRSVEPGLVERRRQARASARLEVVRDDRGGLRSRRRGT